MPPGAGALLFLQARGQREQQGLVMKGSRAAAAAALGVHLGRERLLGRKPSSRRYGDQKARAGLLKTA